MNLLQRLRIGTTVLLSSIASADLKFPDSGVWSQPRIYDGTKEVSDYSSIPFGVYTFKTRIDEVDGQESTGNLSAEIIGSENYFHNWEVIVLSANSESYRQWTQEIQTIGDYNFSFSLDNGQKIERGFTIIPESPPLVFWSLPILQFFRKKK